MFDGLVDETLCGYDRIIGLDLSEVAVDGSQHKAPFGGEGAGPNPVDRGKCGWKWSIATERNGIPIGWEQAGANRNDCVLLAGTLDAVDARGLLGDIDTLHLDRGYDNSIMRVERRTSSQPRRPLTRIRASPHTPTIGESRLSRTLCRPYSLPAVAP